MTPYNGQPRRELLRLDKNFNVENLITLMKQMCTSLHEDKQLKHKELDLLLEQEKTKQLQLELRILELKNQTIQPRQSMLPTPGTQQKLSDVEAITEYIETYTEYSVITKNSILLMKSFQYGFTTNILVINLSNVVFLVV